MALIICPECNRQVSSVAVSCPNCGFPVAEKAGSAATPATLVQSADPSQPLAEIMPSWWGYFWHLFFFFLIIPPIIAWWQRGSTVLRVFPGRITLDRGRLSKCFREFMIQDIRAVDIDQGFISRIVGIGDLTISTAASADATEKVNGIPDPHRVRELILAERQRR
ncbi:MAG TPA: PH domain-containing protein [Candidatus Limnocylindria bacterium]|nr:PH domain-containing protein [Candidatus Limnocylindria bacterium]